MTRYRIGQPIGSGGMAEILEAWRLLPNGKEWPVALKRLLPEYGSHADALIRFEREAMICLDISCEHPNLVSVFDFDCTEDGALYIVMERVDGISLDRLLTVAPLAIPVVRTVLREIARALEFVHSHRVLHRDISPRNALVARDGTVKILDFGLARDLGAPRSTFGFKGTPAYASPEAIHGMNLDPSADLYSMAAVGYHLLSGQPPYGFGHTVQINRRMSIHDIPPLPDSVPADLSGLIMGLLQPIEHRRIKSASEFLAVLGGPCASAETLADLVQDILEHEREAIIEAKSLFGEDARPWPVDRAPGASHKPVVSAGPRVPSRPRVRPFLMLMGFLALAGIGYALVAREPAPGDEINAKADSPVIPTKEQRQPEEEREPEIVPEPPPAPDTVTETTQPRQKARNRQTSKVRAPKAHKPERRWRDAPVGGKPPPGMDLPPELLKESQP